MLYKHLDLFKLTAKFKEWYVLWPYNQSTEEALAFVKGWTPPTILLTDPYPPVAPVYCLRDTVKPKVPFLQELRYPQYLNGLKASNRHFQQLVQIPDKATTSWLKHKPTRHLELGLCTIYNILTNYLRHFNVWLNYHKMVSIHHLWLEGSSPHLSPQFHAQMLSSSIGNNSKN